MSIALEPPRWPGGPAICPVANLPAFRTSEGMQLFMDAHCGTALAKWRCQACERWHYWAKVPAPAGGSSGTSRGQRIPPEIQALVQGAAVRDGKTAFQALREAAGLF